MRLSLTMIVLAALMNNAQAMNWEGHDDWMVDLPAARKLEEVGEQKVHPLDPPAKSQRCMDRDKIGHVPPNPYENVLPVCPAGGRQSK
jgi:hypothetical protein